MANDALYNRLADHFDHFIVGAPRTDTLIDILRILFPLEEAELALHMPVMHKMTRIDLEAALPQPTPRIQPILDTMAARGTVQTYRGQGEEDRYALLPSAKGWFETALGELVRPGDRRHAPVGPALADLPRGGLRRGIGPGRYADLPHCAGEPRPEA